MAVPPAATRRTASRNWPTLATRSLSWTLPRPARAVVVLLAAGFGLYAAATLAPGLVS
jgi:hypothetical protein